MSQMVSDEQVAFQIILHSGNARSNILQALAEFKQDRIDQYEQLMERAEQDLLTAHQNHFRMIQKEAESGEQKLSLLLVHAEDHLMSTMTMKDIVKAMMEILHKKK
ncbi:MAG: PTS lactose/cellobiose transporter subunit IIA [Brevibacillus sp.]|nr:PTS lactose/cellobiose transporter subunit IIA [Brevibacillus sp.]